MSKRAVGGSDSRAIPSDLRTQLVERAGVMFRLNGFAGTSVDAIGAELGVSGPALYYHFGSKADLLFECLRMPMVEQIARCQQATLAEPPERQLPKFVETHVQCVLAQPYVRELRGNSAVSMGVLVESLPPPQRREVRSLMHEHVTDLKEIIASGMAKGVFRIVDPTAVSFAILGMADNVMWVRPDGPLTKDSVARMYGDLALAMVANVKV
ncbi:TetR/AcrR family transcriptional regulator [Microtetraspora malaysiensis]|uniref:TetR/AcrR family transcriptional regulator n=1 Tax=Microtetraspora malaysiensis TaxID=161358 RepID=UPI003D8C9147